MLWTFVASERKEPHYTDHTSTILKKLSTIIQSRVLFFIIAIAASTYFVLERTRLHTNPDRRRSHHHIPNGSHPCHNTDFAPVHKKAVWTMVTDDPQYIICAMKLGHSLRTHTTESRFDMVLMELSTKPLGSSVWGCLREVGWQRCVVDRIVPLDEAATQSMQSRWLDQFTKLHLWGMTMYDTLLYLDSDTLTLRSIDHLLHRNLGNKSIAVAAQTWRGGFEGFNMGVFVINPRMQEYERLLDLQQDPSVQFHKHWAEQGFLNVVYKDKWDDLGFTNNALAWTSWQNHEYWMQQFPHINIIHYTGMKPWTCVPDVFVERLRARPIDYTPICLLWLDVPVQCNSTVPDIMSIVDRYTTTFS